MPQAARKREHSRAGGETLRGVPPVESERWKALVRPILEQLLTGPKTMDELRLVKPKIKYLGHCIAWCEYKNLVFHEGGWDGRIFLFRDTPRGSSGTG